MNAKRTTFLLVAVLAVYLVIVVIEGIGFIKSGSVVALILGLAILMLPVVGVWVVWRELRFGWKVRELAGVLETEGGLPKDDLPRTVAGRVARSAADRAFEAQAEQTQADPGNWRSWYRLAAAYDAAGDRRRARSAMRQALELYAPAGQLVS